MEIVRCIKSGEEENAAIKLIPALEKKYLLSAVGENGEQLVHLAAAFGCGDFIRALSEIGKLNPQQLTAGYRIKKIQNNIDYVTDIVNPLILAAVGKQYEVIAVFDSILPQANMNQFIMGQNIIGETLLHYAAEKNDMELMGTFIGIMRRNMSPETVSQNLLKIIDVARSSEMRALLRSDEAESEVARIAALGFSDAPFPLPSQLPALDDVGFAAAAAAFELPDSSVELGAASQLSAGNPVASRF
jgi:hypothetical protein